MVIDNRQKKRIKKLEFFITCMGWIYILGFVLHTGLSLVLWYFNLSNIFYELFVLESVTDTLTIITITAFTASMGFFIMVGWKYYNVRRFGSLNRRKFRQAVTLEDISQYFGLDIEEVDGIQNGKWIDLEETIV